jgi:hypothetical protein
MIGESEKHPAARHLVKEVKDGASEIVALADSWSAGVMPKFAVLESSAEDAATQSQRSVKEELERIKLVKRDEGRPARRLRSRAELPDPSKSPQANVNRTTEQTNFRVTPEFHEEIKRAAAARGLSKTAFMKAAIAAAIAAANEDLPPPRQSARASS